MKLDTTTGAVRCLLALLGAVALVGLAGCGDDDDDATGDGMVIETDRNTETPGDDGAAGDGAAGDEVAGGGADLDGLGDCAKAGNAMARTAGSLTSPGEFDGGIEALAEVAPDELQSDVDVLADAVDEMQAAFDRAGVESGDPAAIDEVVDEHEGTVGPARDAMQNLEDHFSEVCG